jgi:hypothetical protein
MSEEHPSPDPGSQKPEDGERVAAELRGQMKKLRRWFDLERREFERRSFAPRDKDEA